MFEVKLSYLIEDEWEEKDLLIYNMAGCHSDYSGAGCFGHGKPSVREHGWFTKTFEDAQKLKQQLSTLDKVTVSLKEK